MILAGVAVSWLVAFVIGLTLRLDYTFNYKTQEGNTVFRTNMDYITEHKYWYLLFALLLVTGVVFVAV